jgi:1-deoxy-D-xylulose 5-phosphate reductoisomerase
VNAFLEDRLSFLGIAAVIEETLERVQSGRVHDFDTLFQADSDARVTATDLVDQGAFAP